MIMSLLKINLLSLCAVSRKDLVTCRFQMKCDEVCGGTQQWDSSKAFSPPLMGGGIYIYIYEWRRQEEELQKLGKNKYL
jgi:hypothetical protein